MKTGVLLFVLIAPCFVRVKGNFNPAPKLRVDQCKTFKTLFSLESSLLTRVQTTYGKDIARAMLNGGVGILKRLGMRGGGRYLLSENKLSHNLVKWGVETEETMSAVKEGVRKAVKKIAFIPKLEGDTLMVCAEGKAAEPLHFANSASKMAHDNEVMAATVTRIFSRMKRLPERTKVYFSRTVGLLLGFQAQQECHIRHELEEFKDLCETAKSENDLKEGAQNDA